MLSFNSSGDSFDELVVGVTDCGVKQAWHLEARLGDSLGPNRRSGLLVGGVPPLLTLSKSESTIGVSEHVDLVAGGSVL